MMMSAISSPTQAYQPSLQHGYPQPSEKHVTLQHSRLTSSLAPMNLFMHQLPTAGAACRVGNDALREILPVAAGREGRLHAHRQEGADDDRDAGEQPHNSQDPVDVAALLGLVALRLCTIAAGGDPWPVWARVAASCDAWRLCTGVASGCVPWRLCARVPTRCWASHPCTTPTSGAEARPLKHKLGTTVSYACPDKQHWAAQMLPIIGRHRIIITNGAICAGTGEEDRQAARSFGLQAAAHTQRLKQMGMYTPFALPTKDFCILKRHDGYCEGAIQLPSSPAPVMGGRGG